MIKNFYRVLFTVVAVFATVAAWADEPVSFKASAPMIVSVGETFRVEFSLNAKPESDTFVAPSFEGFDMIAGPATSQGSSIQIINGKMTKSVNISYTYVLVASEAGNFTIGSSKIKVDNKEYSSNAVPIEVVKEQQSQSQAASSRGSNADASSSSRIAKDDILLRTTVSRKTLFKGEPLRATIKLYSRVPIAGVEGEKFPSFNGFWSQPIDNATSQGAKRETYNGKVYDVHTLRDYILYPQQGGDLTIEPSKMTVIAQVIVQSRNVDPFFGGGHEVYNVRREISSPAITLDVKTLPAGAPSSFMDAVGQFNISASLPKQDILTNTSSTLTVKIEGRGNLSFIQAPTVDFPKSFEIYSVKTTESLTPSPTGSVGYKQYDYPFIARSQGEYTIPALEFSYFDPTTQKYETIQTQPFVVTVSPDGSEQSSAGDTARLLQGGGVSKSDVKMLGSDIRFIKLKSSDIYDANSDGVFVMAYIVIIALLCIAFIASLIIIKMQMRLRENTVLVKGKRANKVAIQRFKAAKEYMVTANEKAFYKEMLRALWGYMSDKLNIPTASLTRENIREQLSKRGASVEQIQHFSEIIAQCEEAQYSPMASAQMSEIYAKGLQLISNIESQIKR
ncbi:MAG: BatD family protein [Rikenellaceae bacterium]